MPTALHTHMIGESPTLYFIHRFVDPKAEFLFVPAEQVMAVAEGFRGLGYRDDHELNAAEWIVYDALYAYCRQMVQAGKLEGAFR